jgi:hypothetical protein
MDALNGILMDICTGRQVEMSIRSPVFSLEKAAMTSLRLLTKVLENVKTRLRNLVRSARARLQTFKSNTK